MKTVSEFYAKYGTGKNYNDLFNIVAAKPCGKFFEEMFSDMESVLNNTFDVFLYEDYKYLKAIKK